jgi:hypothetical protein
MMGVPEGRSEPTSIYQAPRRSSSYSSDNTAQSVVTTSGAALSKIWSTESKQVVKDRRRECIPDNTVATRPGYVHPTNHPVLRHGVQVERKRKIYA